MVVIQVWKGCLKSMKASFDCIIAGILIGIMSFVVLAVCAICYPIGLLIDIFTHFGTTTNKAFNA